MNKEQFDRAQVILSRISEIKANIDEMRDTKISIITQSYNNWIRLRENDKEKIKSVILDMLTNELRQLEMEFEKL